MSKLTQCAKSKMMWPKEEGFNKDLQDLATSRWPLWGVQKVTKLLFMVMLSFAEEVLRCEDEALILVTRS